MIDSPYLIRPGSRVRLKSIKTSDTGRFKDKADAEAASKKNLDELFKLQDVLYADGTKSLLVVLQAMDAVDMGGHTLLDESVVFFGSELAQPPTHSKADMPFLNHNGLDVRTEADVDAAYEIVKRDAERWGLHKITKPVVQHGTYCFYFWDMDDNAWEILANPEGGYSWGFDLGDQSVGALRARRGRRLLVAVGNGAFRRRQRIGINRLMIFGCRGDLGFIGHGWSPHNVAISSLKRSCRASR